MASSRDIKAGAAYVEMFLKDARLTKGLSRVAARLKAFGASISGMGKRLLGLSAAIAAPLALATKHFLGYGDQLSKMSQRTGISVESLSELAHAAGQSGSGIEDVEKAVRKMQQTISDAAQGEKTYVEELERIGLSTAKLAAMSPESQFNAIAAALTKIEDPTAKAAASMAIFGRSGTAMLPMLADGIEGMEALRAEARELGLTISTDAANSAVRLGDQLGNVWSSVKAGAFAIAASLAPTLSDLTTKIQRIVTAVVKWVQANQPLVRIVAAVAAGIALVGPVLIAVGSAISALGFAIAGVVMGVGALGTLFTAVAGGVTFLFSSIGAVVSAIGSAVAFLLTPLGIVLAVIAAATAAVLYFSGAGAAALTWLSDTGAQALAWLGERFQSIKATAQAAFKGIADALKANDIKLAAKIVWLGVKLEFLKGVQPMLQAWVELKTGVLLIFTHIVAGIQKAMSAVQKAILLGVIALDEFLQNRKVEFDAFLTKEQVAAEKKKIESTSNLARMGVEIAFGVNDKAIEAEAAKAGIKIAGSAAKGIFKNRADLAAAGREFDAALAEARTKAAAAEIEADAPARPELPDVRMPDLPGIAGKAATSAGTFSSVAGSRIGGGSDRMAADTAASRKHLASIEREMRKQRWPAWSA